MAFGQQRRGIPKNYSEISFLIGVYISLAGHISTDEHPSHSRSIWRLRVGLGWLSEAAIDGAHDGLEA